MKMILNCSWAYFVIVFSFGFVFGAIRVLFVAPYLGEEKAEVFEAPIMIMVSYLASRYIARMVGNESTQLKMLIIGLLALFYLLVVEFSFVFWLRELDLEEYLSSKYSVAGLAYVVSLFLYTIFPYLVYRSRKNT